MTDWDNRYADKVNLETGAPSSLLIRMLSSCPSGRALDIACGEGRNAVFLAKQGYIVDAVDASPVALERGRCVAEDEGQSVNFIKADLGEYQIEAESYNLIINFNYLQRSLIPAMINGLKKGGVILFETFTLEQKEIGSPRNPDYLLEPNELLRLFEGMHVIFFREGVFEEEGRKKAISSIVVKRI